MIKIRDKTFSPQVIKKLISKQFIVAINFCSRHSPFNNYVSVNSKPEHPPAGKLPGNFLKGRIPQPPGTKKVRNPGPWGRKIPPGGRLPYEEYTGVCHELGSYFQEKIPKRVCQFFTKIPERAIISVRNSRQGQLF